MAEIAEFHPAAREEFDEAFDWYAARSRGAAIGFASAVDAALEQIAADPERFAKTYAGCRCYLVGRYPYQVIFRRSPRGVHIVAIAHAKRRPGYWRTRLKG